LSLAQIGLVFNANLMLAFFFNSFAGCFDVQKLRGKRLRRQGDNRAVLPHGLLTGIPIGHRPDFLRREGGEKQVRIIRLPGRRLGFIQGQPDQPFRRGNAHGCIPSKIASLTPAICARIFRQHAPQAFRTNRFLDFHLCLSDSSLLLLYQFM
jgi:hypothetical protein